MYEVPDGAGKASKALRSEWNRELKRQYGKHKEWSGRFFSLDPKRLRKQPVVQVKWFADPEEPEICHSNKVANKLVDWLYFLDDKNHVHWHYKGRRLHNEYCEFSYVLRPDAKGVPRIKRVRITTELRAWWLTAAMHNPVHLRDMATEVLGRTPTWEELYGVSDPIHLSPRERETLFCLLNAGNGEHKDLRDRGIPEHPVGTLNNQNAMFMSHPINGLDDLLYIIMFGAHPYAKDVGDQYHDVTHEQLFRQHKVEHLACRHADPAAASASYNTAWEGRTIALADPMRVTMLNFTPRAFRYRRKPIPERWVRFKRNRQHLEFGPSDRDKAFLSDISVATGGRLKPLTGGYQILQNLEVGVRLHLGPTSFVENEEHALVTAKDDPIDFQQTKVCKLITAMNMDYEAE